MCTGHSYYSSTDLYPVLSPRLREASLRRRGARHWRFRRQRSSSRRVCPLRVRLLRSQYKLNKLRNALILNWLVCQLHSRTVEASPPSRCALADIMAFISLLYLFCAANVDIDLGTFQLDGQPPINLTATAQRLLNSLSRGVRAANYTLGRTKRTSFHLFATNRTEFCHFHPGDTTSTVLWGRGVFYSNTSTHCTSTA